MSLKRTGQDQSRRLCHHAASHTITLVAQRFVHKSVHKLGPGAGPFVAIKLADCEKRPPDEVWTREAI